MNKFLPVLRRFGDEPQFPSLVVDAGAVWGTQSLFLFLSFDVCGCGDGAVDDPGLAPKNQ